MYAVRADMFFVFVSFAVRVTLRAGADVAPVVRSCGVGVCFVVPVARDGATDAAPLADDVVF